MIIWKQKEVLHPRDTVVSPTYCRAFRWTFQINRWSIGFVHQYNPRGSVVWCDSHTQVFEIALARTWKTPKLWRVKKAHVYYDGPHCMLTIGPIIFQWGGNPRTGWCKKCMPDE